MNCEKHRVPLRLIGHDARGKAVWRCPHSHAARIETGGAPMCRKCLKEYVYSEGLCYRCWYYR